MKLSSEAKMKYESKVVSAGLNVDPYVTAKTRKISRKFTGAMSCFTWFPLLALIRRRQSRYANWFHSTTDLPDKQAWKGMVDSAGFVKAGWVHDMLLHRFSDNKFVIKGKVWQRNIFVLTNYLQVLFQVKHSQRMSATSLVPFGTFCALTLYYRWYLIKFKATAFHTPTRTTYYATNVWHPLVAWPYKWRLPVFT